MLKPTDNDSRANPYSFGKIVYGSFVKTPLRMKSARARGGISVSDREPVRFRLILLHFRINDTIGQVFCRVVDHKGPLVPVKKDVADFMKEREPQLVISLVSKR